ncbi:MAG: vgr related protein [Sandarakinorhabdus sp.]|nr:vgr related protein [Sandarakinorhabdus sp.]
MPSTNADRPLTPAEIALVDSVFGAALDPAQTSVRHRKFWMFHPFWVTMAPDGHIWCHPNGFDWCADYAAEPLGMRAHFVHEMVHVWQVQQGRNLIITRPPLARYGYVLALGKPFSRYGVEQQACIVADAYRRRERGDIAGLVPYGAILPFGDWGA